MNEQLKELITHPITGFAVIASAALSLLAPLAPVWDFVGATAGTWFPIVAVSASTILPELGFGSIGSKILLAGAIVYVTVFADRLYDRIEERYS
jgi:hypothetical protein